MGPTKSLHTPFILIPSTHVFTFASPSLSLFFLLWLHDRGPINVLSRLVPPGWKKGVIEGFMVAKELVHLTHLQFANDTIIFGLGWESSFINLHRFLWFLAEIFRLEINRSKSSLLGINCCPFKLSLWASMVGCDVCQFPSHIYGSP